MTIPEIVLNNGVTIPQLGFGVFQVEPSKAKSTVLAALEAGYRHIDTAQMYGNEEGVGQAVAASGLSRDEVFITSKLNNPNHPADRAKASFEQTLELLGSDHVDLFLIHWPLPAHDRYVEAWETLVGFLEDGRARAIGVSNFHESHLQRLADAGLPTPAANQIEVHPYLTQQSLRAANTERGIATEAWSPIARGRVLADPAVLAVAGAVGRTPSQVVLRWAIQRGDIVFPKSSHPERMRENLNLFDFELSDEQMAAITALDRGERTGPNPDEFNWIPE